MITFHFEIPQALILSSNHRKHRMETARTIKHLRIMGAAAARGHDPIEDQALLTVRIGWPDRRRRDAPNLWPTCKPLIDGIVDSGFLIDDDDDHLVGPDLRPYYLGRRGLTVLDFEFEATA